MAFAFVSLSPSVFRFEAESLQIIVRSLRKRSKYGLRVSSNPHEHELGYVKLEPGSLYVWRVQYLYIVLLALVRRVSLVSSYVIFEK